MNASLIGLQLKDLFTLTVALSALAVSVFNFRFSRTKDRTIQTYLFLNEWRTPEFHDVTRYIRKEFADELTVDKIKGGIRGLPEIEARKIRRVTHFLDYSGRALQTGIIDKRLMLTTIGEPVLRLWLVLGPLILRERELIQQEAAATTRSKNPYVQRWQSGFEHFAEEARLFREKSAYRDAPFKGGILTPRES